MILQELEYQFKYLRELEGREKIDFPDICRTILSESECDINMEMGQSSPPASALPRPTPLIWVKDLSELKQCFRTLIDPRQENKRRDNETHLKDYLLHQSRVEVSTVL